MSDKLKRRDEVDEALTWNLSLIYPDKESMYRDLSKAAKMAEEIVRTYKGHLAQAEKICDCMEAYEKVLEILVLVQDYATLSVEVDYYNNENMDMSNRVQKSLAIINSQLSFIDSEISGRDYEVLEQAISQATSSKLYLKKLLRYKSHMLHPEAERVLAALVPSMEVPYELYNNIKLADMEFEPFVVDGKRYPLGYSLFEDHYEYEVNTKIRRKAFDAFSDKIRQYVNGTATAYNAYVQNEKILANLRGFSSMTEMNLYEDEIPSELYHRHLDLIMERLAPHMRKYARILKKVHHLERMTYADLKLPIDPDYAKDISIDESKTYIKKGLSIMGEDYLDMIEDAYRNRWIDFASNQGKCTGGFCESPYGRDSFILLSWNHKMSDVFTLAHELGHAGHFRLCNKAQSIFDTEVGMYFVEAPSTMNELLMAHYMLKNNDEKRFRRWVLANMVGNTYYHNFVTHFLEAYYQREVYRIVEAGGSLQADTLNGIFLDTLKRFWGDEVELVPGAELTWMRQPHYYMGLYSYTYSAGLSIATQMCKRIEAEGEAAVEDWKKVLRAGSTMNPVDLAALGGIDIKSEGTLLDTIETIGYYIDEIERLSEELE